MPGPISQSYAGPKDTDPYLPSWCYEEPRPYMCACGHHEGYHDTGGICIIARYHDCKCMGYEQVKP